MQAPVIRDVNEEEFDEAVVRRSQEVPVVVDFWAPWCGPCRALSPLLERLAAEADGAWELVKINVDDNPSLSMRFQVQGIPAVKGFRDGRPVAEFVGAQGERAVRAFLARLLPSEADGAVTEAAQAQRAGDAARAEALLRGALELEPAHRGALLGLGRLLAERPDGAAEAERLLAEVPAGTPEGGEAAGLLARLRFARGASAAPDGTGDPLDAAWTAGMAAAAAGRYAEALQHLLGVVERNRRYRDGAAQAAIRDIFAILGDDDPLTVEYRRLLSRALFS